jgi:D-alanyl-lipoteichoic acid acyltransferase DltB (MBOAT superfamily)
MSFVSFSFVFLLGAVLLLRAVADRFSLPKLFLFGVSVASLVFYGWHVPAYLGLILFSTAVDFVAGGQIAGHEGRPDRRRFWLIASVVVNLGALGLFKYFDFAVREFAILASALGFAGSDLPQLQLALPIGLSFYTFQSMSYTIDVYRRRIQPVSSFGHFLLYVSFFPQLVAGPIVRAGDFLYQIERRRRIRARVWLEGGYLIVRGYFLKMVVADNIAILVDANWALGAQPEGGGFRALYVALLFSCQIFADFAGYSSIARGLGYLLGFRLPLNFDAPYIAASLHEFWQRWHITLSQWLRDYLYIPLGGNRLGTVRTYLNLLVVMLLGGLWHGAANTFLMWGAIHGVALAIERALGMSRDLRSWPLRLLWALAIQGIVLVAWVCFRSASLTEAMAIITGIVTGPQVLPDASLIRGLLLVVPVAMIHLRALGCARFGVRRPGVLEKAFWAGIMTYLIATAHGESTAFIYFQF